MVKQFRSAIAAVGILALSLTACGGSAESSGGSATGTTDGVQEITFSSWTFTEKGRGEALQGILDDFNASQSKVHVTQVAVPYPSYASTVMTQLGAGAGADVVQLDAGSFFAAMQYNLVQDITDSVPAPANAIDVDATCVIDGKRFCVTGNVDNFALLVNQDLLDAADVKMPTTTDELAATAAALTDKDAGQFGYGFRSTMTQQVGWWQDLSNFVYGFGGRWTTPDGVPTVNTPEVIKAVTLYKELFDTAVPQGNDAATNRQMFWEGKVAMMYENSGVANLEIANNPELNLTVVPAPFPDPENVLQFIAWTVNSASQHKDASAIFINYLMQPGVQKKLSEGLDFTRLATEIDWTGNADYPKFRDVYVKTFADVVLPDPEGAETFTLPFSTEVLNQMDLVLRQGKDPATAMGDAQTALESLLQK